MINGFHIKTIDDGKIENKKILVRVDFDVSLNLNYTIADDIRIRQNLPTLQYLLKNQNKLICVAKLNRPKGRDLKHSLKVVVDKLQEYLPDYKTILVDDFLASESIAIFEKQTEDQILVLENIRFYPEEKNNDQGFAKRLASLADVYVNDAFAVCLRKEASIIGVPHFLPSYAGFLLKKEIEMISKAIKNSKNPLVAIIGGAKVSTKLDVLNKLIEVADYVLIGGALANTFLCAQDIAIGKSFCELDTMDAARKLLFLAAQKNTAVILPSDVIIGNPNNSQDAGTIKKVNEIPKDASILDIGPETQAKFGSIIGKAKTIIWNGPMGYFENPLFKRGTDFIYYSITHNIGAISIVGGGDTLAAISKKEYWEKITHISTGGGAMLEFIEKGTLPGIEALQSHSSS